MPPHGKPSNSRFSSAAAICCLLLLVATAAGNTLQRGPPGGGAAASSGACRCPRLFLPVCGSDGAAYNSKCEAECKGVTVTGQRPVNGQCNSGPLGPVNPSGPGFNPSGPANTRPWFQGQGANPQPGRGCPCPLIFSPVCGADGSTYDNTCIAECRGVKIIAKGSC